MPTEIVFQLTRRELDALLALDASPAATPHCDPRTLQALVNKGLVTRSQNPTLTHAASLFISFTRACGLFTSHSRAGEGRESRERASARCARD